MQRGEMPQHADEHIVDGQERFVEPVDFGALVFNGLDIEVSNGYVPIPDTYTFRGKQYELTPEQIEEGYTISRNGVLLSPDEQKMLHDAHLANLKMLHGPDF